MQPSSLNTGIAEIDVEHAQLITHERMISSICPDRRENCAACDASRHATCNEKLIHVYDELIGLVVDHFRSEEQLMAWLPQEIAHAHKREHAELSARLTELLLKPPVGPTLVRPSELGEIVNQWLVNHITDWDIPLARMQRATESRQPG